MKKGQIITIMMNGFAYCPFNKCKQPIFSFSTLHLSNVYRQSTLTHSLTQLCRQSRYTRRKSIQLSLTRELIEYSRKSPFTNWCTLYYTLVTRIKCTHSWIVYAMHCGRRENSDKRCEWAKLSWDEQRWDEVMMISRKTTTHIFMHECELEYIDGGKTKNSITQRKKSTYVAQNLQTTASRMRVCSAEDMAVCGWVAIV